MVESVHQYIKYHSEPCSGFVSMKEWNEHFGTNLEENEELEYKIMKLRSELGHNEFIPMGLLKIARKLKEKAKKGVQGAIEDKTSIYKSNYVTNRWKKALGGAFHVGYATRKWKKYKAKRETKQEPADVEQKDAQEEKEEEQVEDLDDLLQAEPEYEEVAPVVDEEEEEGEDDGATRFQQAVDQLEISDAQALNHLIAFKGETDDIRTRVMKGKARYIEKLQAYLKGDEDAAIRMYNGVKVKIAHLNPNKKSLLTALQAFPSGPHFIECD
jgi:hypothetical protein